MATSLETSIRTAIERCIDYATAPLKAELAAKQQEIDRLKADNATLERQLAGEAKVLSEQLARSRELRSEIGRLKAEYNREIDEHKGTCADVERLQRQLEDAAKNDRWFAGEIERLLTAIRKHRDQKADDRCWEDDLELYRALPEGISDAELSLPPKEEFLVRCARYEAHRRCGTSPEWKSVASLEAEIGRLKAEHPPGTHAVCDVCGLRPRDKRAETCPGMCHPRAGEPVDRMSENEKEALWKSLLVALPNFTGVETEKVHAEIIDGQNRLRRHLAPAAALGPQGWQQMVRDFHVKFGCTINDHPTTDVPQTFQQMRFRLAQEEVAELGEALERKDLVGIADALADSIYVLLGTAVTYGIDLAPVFAEVHRTNMAKDGGVTRADGKILKPAGWQPPDIAGLIERQQSTAAAGNLTGPGPVVPGSCASEGAHGPAAALSTEGDKVEQVYRALGRQSEPPAAPAGDGLAFYAMATMKKLVKHGWIDSRFTHPDHLTTAARGIVQVEMATLLTAAEQRAERAEARTNHNFAECLDDMAELCGRAERAERERDEAKGLLDRVLEQDWANSLCRDIEAFLGAAHEPAVVPVQAEPNEDRQCDRDENRASQKLPGPQESVADESVDFRSGHVPRPCTEAQAVAPASPLRASEAEMSMTAGIASMADTGTGRILLRKMEAVSAELAALRQQLGEAERDAKRLDWADRAVSVRKHGRPVWQSARGFLDEAMQEREDIRKWMLDTRPILCPCCGKEECTAIKAWLADIASATPPPAAQEKTDGPA